MPYVKKDQRAKYNQVINDAVKTLYATGDLDVGELNYVISSIVWQLFDRNKRYKTANDLLGVLNAVNLEFYRRKVENYENEKMAENGDINE